jgi:hypothetical protein
MGMIPVRLLSERTRNSRDDEEMIPEGITPG